MKNEKKLNGILPANASLRPTIHVLLVAKKKRKMFTKKIACIYELMLSYFRTSNTSKLKHGNESLGLTVFLV